MSVTRRLRGPDPHPADLPRRRLPGVWDQLLECRIKLQPALQLCGQLPAPGERWTDFWAAAGDDTAARLTDAAAAADRLLRQLLQLQVSGCQDGSVTGRGVVVGQRAS